MYVLDFFRTRLGQAVVPTGPTTNDTSTLTVKRNDGLLLIPKRDQHKRAVDGIQLPCVLALDHVIAKSHENLRCICLRWF